MQPNQHLQNQTHAPHSNLPKVNGVDHPGTINSANHQTNKYSELNSRENGKIAYHDKSQIQKNNLNDWQTAAEDAQRDAAPNQSFENASFSELMAKYEGTQGTAKTAIDLTQAMLMTTNHRETAANLADPHPIKVNQNGIASGPQAKVGSSPDG